MALRVSIGQYYSVDSPIHRLDPRVKLVAALAYMVGCLFVHGPASLAIATVAAVLAVRAARVPLGRLVSQVKPVLFFLIVTGLFNLFAVGTGPLLAQVGPVAIHAGGLSAAVLYTMRFFLLLLVGGLLMLTTTSTALCDAFEALCRPLERLGAPVGQAALVLSIALRFVPALSREVDNLVVAQTARGANLEGKGPLAFARACLPLVVPLFASSLRHAENLGRALDARCYTGGAGRTHYRELRLEPRRDLPFCAATALYLVLLGAACLLG